MALVQVGFFLPFGPMGGRTDRYGWVLQPPGGRTAYGSAMSGRKGSVFGQAGPAYLQLPHDASRRFMAPPSRWGRQGGTYASTRAAYSVRNRLRTLGTPAEVSSYQGGWGVWVTPEQSDAAYRIATMVGRKTGLSPIRFRGDGEDWVGFRTLSYPRRWF